MDFPATPPAAPIDERAWPAEGATRAPYWVFTDPEIYAREQERIYRGPFWHFVALEAEIPEPGDFKATYVGEAPVVVTRDAGGGVGAWVNRCAHRGALVCREERGNARTHTCVYHQWCYDAAGKLIGVPFRRGLKGKGGYPEDFKLAEHGLETLRVESYRGVVFATFSREAPDLASFLGPMGRPIFDMLFAKPLRILGYHRQYMHGNWKLYTENLRDPYHGSLLHLFHTTFGTFRGDQRGECTIDASGLHSMLIARRGTDVGAFDNYANDPEAKQKADIPTDFGENQSRFARYQLQDPSLLERVDEFGDDITTIILSLFPSLVLQRGAMGNALAMRQVLPKGPGEMELLWIHYGYADDSPALTDLRHKQNNYFGPAGFAALEDGEAVEIVQRAVEGDPRAASFIEMGGRDVGDVDHMITETGVRAMWGAYRDLMGL